MNAATTLDGNPISVTAAGKADAFGYLAGSFKADDNDPAAGESQVYLTKGATPPGRRDVHVPARPQGRDGDGSPSRPCTPRRAASSSR